MRKLDAYATELGALVSASHDLSENCCESFGRWLCVVGKPAATRARLVTRDESEIGFSLLRPCHARKLGEVNAMAVDAAWWTDISDRDLPLILLVFFDERVVLRELSVDPSGPRGRFPKYSSHDKRPLLHTWN